MLRNKLMTWLLYPLALRLKRWASAILAAGAETIESEALKQSAATQEIRDSTSDVRTETGPPAHWLKRVSSSPPRHWVELVRGVAPKLQREGGVPDATSSSPPPTRPPARSAGPPPPLRLERPRTSAARLTEPIDSSARQVSSEASANKEHQTETSDRRQTTASPEPAQERERSDASTAPQVRIDSAFAPSASSSAMDHPMEAAESDQEANDRQRRTRRATRSESSRHDDDTATQSGAGLRAQPSRPSQRSAAAGELADELPARTGDRMGPEQTASPAIAHPTPPREIIHSRQKVRNVREDSWLESTFAEPACPIKTAVENRRATSRSASFPAPQRQVIYSRERDGVKWNRLADTPANEGRAVTTQNATAEPSRSAHRQSHFRAGPSLPGSTLTGLWPELPEAASMSYADELSDTLRAMARRRRLEREQTGSIWSE